jgi:hypothetical protein
MHTHARTQKLEIDQQNEHVTNSITYPYFSKISWGATPPKPASIKQKNRVNALIHSKTISITVE